MTLHGTIQAAPFCILSLGDWLDLCQKADIPHIPAEEIASISREVLIHFDYPSLRQKEELESFYRALDLKKEPGFMFRWDFCASEEVKHFLATGHPEWREDFLDLPIDDPRAFDILFEFPPERVRAWKRPWMPAKVIEGYPVEFRVFVEGGQVLGVSSYYPQRPLPDTKWIESRWATCKLYSFHIIEELSGNLLILSGGAATRTISFTADFLVTQAGKVLFIEGGPPHSIEAGAHPCCFPPGKISGIALAPLPGAIQ